MVLRLQLTRYEGQDVRLVSTSTVVIAKPGSVDGRWPQFCAGHPDSMGDLPLRSPLPSTSLPPTHLWRHLHPRRLVAPLPRPPGTLPRH